MLPRLCAADPGVCWQQSATPSGLQGVCLIHPWLIRFDTEVPAKICLSLRQQFLRSKYYIVFRAVPKAVELVDQRRGGTKHTCTLSVTRRTFELPLRVRHSIHLASVRCLTVLPLRRERRCKPFRTAQLFSAASWAAACWAARNAGASASWNEE